jgi:AraC family L-rhamnose operon transcriptional activator RhaR
VAEQEVSGANSRHRFADLNLLSLSVRLGNFTGETLYWGVMEPQWWRNYLHIHTFFEVCYAFCGRGTFRMPDTLYEVQAGEVFVARPGEPHEIISSEDDPLGIYYWSYTLVPCRDRQPDEREIDVLLDAFALSNRWVSRQTGEMEATLKLLTEEIARKQPAYRRAIEGLVAKLFLDTARAVVDTSCTLDPVEPRARSSGEAAAQSIVRYLRDNYARPLSRRDVAAQIHLSERHTSRLFTRAMGVSVMDYLTSLRLETAAQMLLDPHLSIKEVAQATGYPDVRYFTTVFRRCMGLTPGAYRREGGTRFVQRPHGPPSGNMSGSQTLLADLQPRHGLSSGVEWPRGTHGDAARRRTE